MWGILQVLLFMLALVVANGLFSAAEIAVVSVRRSRIRQLMEDGDARARAVDRLHGQTERFFATVQIGISLVGALGAAWGGAALADPLAVVLRQVPLGFVQRGAEQLALATVVVGFAFVSVVIGELVPKSLALRYAEPMALRLARSLLWLGVVAKPAVWLLTGAANLVLKPFADRTSFAEARLTAEEIKLLVGEAAESGAIEKRGAEIIERAVDFGELTVADVLIPRPQVVALDVSYRAEDVRRILLEEGHTRMPVYEGDLDHVIGYITARDVLPFVAEQQLIVLRDIIRPAYFAPVTVRAIDLLRSLQRRHEHLAIAVDEYGGTAGIVTTEDLVEEIVGDLFSEDVPAPQLIRREPGGTVLVSGLLTIREFNRELEADLPEDQGFDTVGGLVTHLAGAIPAAGPSFTAHGYEFTVVERSERRVKQIRVRPAVPTPATG
ncbi:MAG: HlyC/CorC family transporter [Deltaproteobacteria bacterium]|nr:HlyC/CorC family transporter [Deltaproteobacteria bacterium]